MTEDEFAYPGALGDASDVVDVGLQPRHSVEVGPGKAVALQVVEVRNLVDENVGASGECDQVVIHRGIAGEHHRSAWGVEPVGEGGVGVAVGHGDGRDSHDSVVEDGDGISRGPVSRRRNRDVDSPHEGSWVRHVTVQGHDVQVIGVTGEDVVDQVRHARGRAAPGGWLSLVGTAHHRRERPGVPPVHRREQAGAGHPLFDAHPPRVQEHAGEVAGVVHVEVAEEDGLQAREVEAGLDEGGRRPPPAVDDEDASVDDKSRGDSRPPGYGHRRPGRSEEDQLSRHRVPLALSSGCGRAED